MTFKELEDLKFFIFDLSETDETNRFELFWKINGREAKSMMVDDHSIVGDALPLRLVIPVKFSRFEILEVFESKRQNKKWKLLNSALKEG